MASEFDSNSSSSTKRGRNQIELSTSPVPRFSSLSPNSPPTQRHVHEVQTLLQNYSKKQEDLESAKMAYRTLEFGMVSEEAEAVILQLISRAGEKLRSSSKVQNMREIAVEIRNTFTLEERQRAYSHALRCVLSPIDYSPERTSRFFQNDFALMRNSCDIDYPPSSASSSSSSTSSFHKTGLSEAYTKCTYFLQECTQRLLNLQHLFFSEEDEEEPDGILQLMKSSSTRGRSGSGGVEEEETGRNHSLSISSLICDTQEEFSRWKRTEERQLNELIQKAKKVPRFVGTLSLQIVSSKELPFKRGDSKQYLTISLEKKSKIVSVDPNLECETSIHGWKADFKVSNIDSEVEIDFWKGKLIGKLHIPLHQYHDQQEHTQWFDVSLDTKSTKSRWPSLSSSFSSSSSSSSSPSSSAPSSPAPCVSSSICLRFRFLYRWGLSSTSSKGTTITSSPSISSSASNSASLGSGKTLLSFLSEHQRLYAVLLNEFIASGQLELQTRGRKRSSKGKARTGKESAKGEGQEGGEGDGEEQEEEKERTKQVSEDLKWLLDDFCIRYGVSPLFARLLQLEYLTHSFTWEIPEVLDEVQEALIEVDVLQSTGEGLSSGIIPKLIIVLSIITTRDTDKLCSIIEQYVEKGMKVTYQMLMDYELQRNLESEVPEDKRKTSALFGMCELIPAALKLDSFLHSEFPSHLNLISLSSRSFHSSLSKDIREEAIHAQEHITRETFDLYFELKRLCDVCFAPCVPSHELLPVDDIFRPFISKWLLKVSDHLKRWIRALGAKETWQILSVENGGDGFSTKTPNELSSKFRQTLNFLRTLKMRTDQDVMLFAKVLCDVSTYYCSRTKTAVLESKGAVGTSSSSSSSSPSASPSLPSKTTSPSRTISSPSSRTSSSCSSSSSFLKTGVVSVAMNNIQAISSELESLSAEVEADYEMGTDFFHLWIADAFPVFNKELYELLIDFVLTPLKAKLRVALEQSLASTDLITPVTSILSSMKSELHPSLHTLVYSIIWKSSIDLFFQFTTESFISQTLLPLVNHVPKSISQSSKLGAKLQHVLQQVKAGTEETTSSSASSSLSIDGPLALVLRALQCSSLIEFEELEVDLVAGEKEDRWDSKVQQRWVKVREFVKTLRNSFGVISPEQRRKEEEARMKKEAEERARKEKEEAEEQTRKEKEAGEEAGAEKQRKEEKERVQKEKEDEEQRVQKEKEEAEEKARKAKEEEDQLQKSKEEKEEKKEQEEQERIRREAEEQEEEEGRIRKEKKEVEVEETRRKEQEGVRKEEEAESEVGYEQNGNGKKEEEVKNEKEAVGEEEKEEEKKEEEGTTETTSAEKKVEKKKKQRRRKK